MGSSLIVFTIRSTAKRSVDDQKRKTDEKQRDDRKVRKALFSKCRFTFPLLKIAPAAAPLFKHGRSRPNQYAVAVLSQGLTTLPAGTILLKILNDIQYLGLADLVI